MKFKHIPLKTKFQLLVTVLVVVFCFTIIYGSVYTINYEPTTRAKLRQAIGVSSSLQNYIIGTRLSIDNKVYRYARFGNITEGVLGGHILSSNVVTTTYTGTSDPGIVDGTSGAYTLRLLDADMNSDSLIGGTITISNDTVIAGPKQSWSTTIALNSDTGTYGSDTVLITLEDPLPMTITPSYIITITANVYSEIVRSTYSDSTIRMAVGANPLYDLDSTGLSWKYFWLQTWGEFLPIYTDSAGSGSNDRTIYHTGLGQVEVPDTNTTRQFFINSWAGGGDTTYFNVAQPVGYYLPKVTTWATDYSKNVPAYLTISP